jgi:hypothetical protein
VALPETRTRGFFACRDYPNRHPHHIVCFEGDRESLVGYGLVPNELIPSALRRRRIKGDIGVHRVKRNHFLVRIILWQDSPLDNSHPLAPLCPTRWPVVDSSTTWKDYIRERFLPLLEKPLQIVHATRSTLLGYSLDRKDADGLERLLEHTAQEFRRRFEEAKVVQLREVSLKVVPRSATPDSKKPA